ncbi:MAG TPA: HDOD domain-containing protein [Spirochaetota bacterium]|nr:HDOD domain-containing protein [Spirochaetota bacterium]
MINEQKKLIYDNINSGGPVKISFKYISDDILVLVNSIIARVLAKYDLLYILHSALTIVRELLVNALKANAKRVFFIKNGLDITNSEEYLKGLSLFKEHIIGDFDFIRQDILSSEYSILFSVSADDENINFVVKNNAGLLESEQSRINKRFAIALQNENFGDIYAQIEGDNEGAGLGIALIVMFLKSMGIPSEFFRIKSDGNVTVSSLTIPRQIKPVEIVSRIKTRILLEVKGIPTFPENVTELIEMCLSPEADINIIADKIKRDVALSSDVIKLANSAGFVTIGKTEDVQKAIVKIGLKNLYSVLIASTARKILETRYSRFEEIWEHCAKVAFYSKALAMKYKLNSMAENVYMAGLLHDIGSVIFLSVDMKSVRRIADIVKNHEIITTNIMEEISIGISHSEIGYLVSKKWNFPDYLSVAIKFHHSPLVVEDEFKDIVYIVYLANAFTLIEKRTFYYHYIEEDILARFNIYDLDGATSLHKYLIKEFENRTR